MPPKRVYSLLNLPNETYNNSISQFVKYTTDPSMFLNFVKAISKQTTWKFFPIKSVYKNFFHYALNILFEDLELFLVSIMIYFLIIL